MTPNRTRNAQGNAERQQQLPSSGKGSYTGDIVNAEFLSAQNGDVGLFITIGVVEPPKFKGSAVIFMQPMIAATPATLVECQELLQRLGLSNAQIYGADVPALLKGKRVRFSYVAPNEAMGIKEQVYILGLLPQVH